MIKREDMFAKLIDYKNKIEDLIANPDVPDKEIFDVMCCSPYAGDEWPGFKATVESAAYGIQEFIYRGFVFKIIAVINEARFVCWIEQRENKEYLEHSYLVPDAWINGIRVELSDIEKIFLPAIDKYLQEIGVDNIK